MVRIGDVWDDAADVLAGRARPLAALAGLTLVLPALVQATFGLASGAPARMNDPVGAVVALLAALVAIWGRLAITGVALDPDTTPAAARAQANQRLLPMLGVLVVLGAAGVLLLGPLLYAMGAAGLDWTALSTGSQAKLPPLGPGAQVYGLALFLFALWAVARIKLLLMPVVAAEGRIIGAIGRGVELTRGLTWKLIGVVVLYYVVVGVCMVAAASVFGLLFRLLLGAGAAQFCTALVAALVGAALDVVAVVFAARLFAAATGAGRIAA